MADVQWRGLSSEPTALSSKGAWVLLANTGQSCAARSACPLSLLAHLPRSLHVEHDLADERRRLDPLVDLGQGLEARDLDRGLDAAGRGNLERLDRILPVADARLPPTEKG